MVEPWLSFRKEGIVNVFGGGSTAFGVTVLVLTALALILAVRPLRSRRLAALATVSLVTSGAVLATYSVSVRETIGSRAVNYLLIVLFPAGLLVWLVAGSTVVLIARRVIGRARVLAAARRRQRSQPGAMDGMAAATAGGTGLASANGTELASANGTELASANGTGPDREDATEPGSTDATEPGSTDATEPGSTDATEPGSTDAAELGSTDATEVSSAGAATPEVGSAARRSGPPRKRQSSGAPTDEPPARTRRSRPAPT